MLGPVQRGPGERQQLAAGKFDADPSTASRPRKYEIGE
jgi:hypothetical protein